MFLTILFFRRALTLVAVQTFGRWEFSVLQAVRAGTIEWPHRIVAGANRPEKPGRPLQGYVSAARNVRQRGAHRCFGGVAGIARLLPGPAARSGR